MTPDEAVLFAFAFEVIDVKVTYASLVEDGVFVEAEAFAQGGWLRSPFDPANAYGYFVPQDATCTVVFPGKDGPLDVGVAQRKSERPTHPGPPPCSSGVSLVYPPRLHPNRKMRTTHV